MANGNFEGKTSMIRLFAQCSLAITYLQSDWYHERLKIKQQRDCMLWQQHRDYILQRISETEQTDSFNSGVDS